MLKQKIIWIVILIVLTLFILVGLVLFFKPTTFFKPATSYLAPSSYNPLTVFDCDCFGVEKNVIQKGESGVSHKECYGFVYNCEKRPFY